MEEKNINQEEEILKNESSQNENLEETVDADLNNNDNVSDISSKLEEKNLKDELEDTKDQYQRLQAEYANYRRRTQQEKETIGLFANEKILADLVPVIDSMERALEACEDKDNSMYKGIDLVQKQLKDTLNKYGIEEIDAYNNVFDPNLHLAVMQESVDGVEPNTVVMVLQKGYKLGSKILRPSMVKVSC